MRELTTTFAYTRCREFYVILAILMGMGEFVIVITPLKLTRHYLCNGSSLAQYSLRSTMNSIVEHVTLFISYNHFTVIACGYAAVPIAHFMK